ncbi:MAG TPA: hypothetical protein PK011_06605 [Marinagarivorans sp.]|nr:hypothetical protein [Cellvibrionaceae bacterium]HMY38977.1 hypothetical protein [Marinagarivorans sp.]HNG59358.1 hypothetical protein [Cellvibrionaceae bacterium]
MLSRLQYQDNVTLSEANPIADTSAQLSLNSRLWRKTQTQESELSIAIKDDNYAEHSEFEQDRRSLSLDHIIKQELGSYVFKGDIDRSTTLGNGFESGEFVRRNIAVNTRGFNASANRYVSEFISASISGGVTQARYQHVLNSDSQDYNDKQYSAAMSYQDADIANWQLSLYTDLLDQLQSKLTVDTTGIALQRNYKWSDLWSLSGKLGRRKTQFAGRTFFGGQFTQENYGRVSSLDIKRAGELNTWGIGASEDLSPRVNGVIDETQRLGIWWETKPSALATLKLNISHVQRKPINTAFFSDDATRYNTLSTGWQYAISETLSTDIQLRWVERAITSRANHDQAESGTASIGLRWQVHP